MAQPRAATDHLHQQDRRDEEPCSTCARSDARGPRRHCRRARTGGDGSHGCGGGDGSHQRHRGEGSRPAPGEGPRQQRGTRARGRAANTRRAARRQPTGSHGEHRGQEVVEVVLADGAELAVAVSPRTGARPALPGRGVHQCAGRAQQHGHARTFSTRNPMTTPVLGPQCPTFVWHDPGRDRLRLLPDHLRRGRGARRPRDRRPRRLPRRPTRLQGSRPARAARARRDPARPPGRGRATASWPRPSSWRRR